MRHLTVTAALVIFSAASGHAQHQPVRSNPGKPCADRSSGLPDFYYDAVLERIRPPDWNKSLIRVIVGGEKKLALWTDGERFKLWTDTPDVPQKTIHDFLFDLDDSCKLPADPADAAALAKVKWESVDLTPAQFAQIHQGLASALSQYLATAQTRYSSMMDTKLEAIYLDSSSFRIAYDNSYEHIEAEVVNDSKQHKPMLEWIFQLQKLAEDRFHHSIWTHRNTEQ